MKIISFTILLAASISTSALAQLELTIFSNEGAFTLFVNGARQNAAPETNVRVAQVQGDQVNIRAVFEDSKLGECKQLLYLPEDPASTWEIRKNNKGKLVLRLVSQGEASGPVAQSMDESATPSPSVESKGTSSGITTQVAEPNAVVVSTAAQNENFSNQDQKDIATVMGVSQGTVSTSTTTGQGGNATLSMSINTNDGATPEKAANASLVININAPATAQSTQTITTTNTQSVHSSSSSYQSSGTTNATPKTEPAINCAIAQSRFKEIIQSIDDKASPSTRMTVAKQTTKGKCLSVDQTIDVMELFASESDKLEFAKYAYDNLLDKDSALQILDVFVFESNVEAFSAFMDSRK